MNEIDPDRSIALDLGEGIFIELCHIPAAGKRFRMGARGIGANEEPRHWVSFKEDFWLGETAMTQAQWKALAERVNLASEIKDLEESRYKGADKGKRAVTEVSWRDCQALLKKLNASQTYRDRIAQAGLGAAFQFSFPSESQWEYACRGRMDTETYCGDGEAALQRVAWYGENWGTGSTHEAGLLGGNPFGLKDLHGNVCEWCVDAWGDDLESNEEFKNHGYSPVDPLGPKEEESDALRVLRGGSWADTAGRCRSAFRDAVLPAVRRWYLGFRLCLCSGPVKNQQASEGPEDAEVEDSTGPASGGAGASGQQSGLSSLNTPPL